MPSLDLQKQSREAAFVRLFCARWHTMSEKSIWALVFLHYNQQIVSWREVQKVCNLTDLVPVEIVSDQRMKLLMFWFGDAISFFSFLSHTRCIIHKDFCKTCSEVWMICEREKHVILIK